MRAEPHDRQRDELADGDDVDSFERAHGAACQRQALEGRVEGGVVGDGEVVVGVGMRRRVRGLSRGFECLVPRPVHLLGATEALLDIGLQCLREERSEASGCGSVEHRLVDRRWRVDHGGVGSAVAVDRLRARGELEQGDSGGVAVGGRIPSLAAFEERVDVAGGAGLDAFDGCRRQREVEQHEVERVLLAAWRDAEVLRLDVAVGAAHLFEVPEGEQQIFAPPFGEFGADGSAGEAARQGAALAEVGAGRRRPWGRRR